MTNPRRSRARMWLILALLSGAWAAIALILVPWLIRQAHAGESLAFLNRLIESPERNPVDGYLAVWSRLAWRLTAVLAIAVAAGLWVRARAGAIAASLRRAAEGLPAQGGAGVLALAAWVGIVTGLLEAGNTFVRYWIKHLPTGEVTWGEAVWATPLAAALSLVAIGALIVALDRGFRANHTLIGAAPFVLVALSAYSFLRALYIGLYPWAALLLAIGIGVSAWRLLAEQPAFSRKIVRSTTVVLVPAIVAWGLSLPVVRHVAEARALSALPAAERDRPNVLLLIWDTTRALNLSTYGHERETTPVLDRLAADGIVFEHAYSTTSWSLPSHASLFTGQWPQDLSADWNTPLDGRQPTLAEALSARGYRTGGFMANLTFGGRAYGLGRGFSWWDDRAEMNPRHIAFTWWLSRQAALKARALIGLQRAMLGRQGDEITDAFLAWAGKRGERPFFAALNYLDAHHPYKAPAPFDRAFTESPPEYWIGSPSAIQSREQLAEVEIAYDTCIRYLDFELGRLLEGLKTLGALDETLIIITSDHGEEFGEQSLRQVRHTESLALPAIHVPLVLWHPGLPGGARVPDIVSIRDVPATVMEFVGGPSTEHFPGVPLQRYVLGADPPGEPRFATLRKPVPASRSETGYEEYVSVLSGRLQYTVIADTLETLHDVQDDPFATRNLVDSPENAGDLEAMRSLLQAEFGSIRASGPSSSRP